MDWSISLLTLQQVLVLAIYLFCGYLFFKRKLITGLKDLTNLVLYLLTPATILGAFLAVKWSEEALKGIVIAALMATLTHILGMVLGHRVYKNEPQRDQVILRFALIFSNAGFFTLPLLRAVFGDEGIFYGSVYVGIFNIFCWTYGVLLMQKQEGDRFSLKRLKPLISNPNLVAIAIGLLLFASRLSLPRIPMDVLASFGAAYGPIAMVLLGAQIASFKIQGLLKDPRLIQLTVMRNILIPLALALIALPFCLHNKTLYLAIVLPAAAPVAGNTAFFAMEYEQDTALAVRSVALSTAAALITIPLLSTLATGLFALLTWIF